MFTHGGLTQYETLCAQDREYRKSALFDFFRVNTSWKNKPIVFFLSACRGTDPVQSVPMRDRPISTFTEQKFPDLFIMNATQPGTYSFTKKQHSALVGEMKSVFSSYGNSIDLCSLAIKVCDGVARNLEYPEDSSIKQMPCFESTLTKKLYFSNKTPTSNHNAAYEKPKEPVALILSYSFGRDQNNSSRVEADRKVLEETLKKIGYKTVCEQDASYNKYEKLCKSFCHYAT